MCTAKVDVLRCERGDDGTVPMSAFVVQCVPRFTTSALLQNQNELEDWSTFAGTHHGTGEGSQLHKECDGSFPVAVGVNANPAKATWLAASIGSTYAQHLQRNLDTVRSYLLYRGYKEAVCGKIVGLFQVKMVQQPDAAAWKRRAYHIRNNYADGANGTIDNVLRCERDAADLVRAMVSFQVECVDPKVPTLFKTSALIQGADELAEWAEFAGTHHETGEGSQLHVECAKGEGRYPAAVGVAEGDRKLLGTVRSWLLYRGYPEKVCGKITNIMKQVRMVEQPDAMGWKTRAYFIRNNYADGKNGTIDTVLRCESNTLYARAMVSFEVTCENPALVTNNSATERQIVCARGYCL